MVNTAIILAGGRGLRLMPLTAEQPKAMVLVLNRPIIEWIILWLKKNNVPNIIISVNYKKENIIRYLGDGKKLGVNIQYNDHTGASETGDAFRSVFSNIKSLPDVVVAMNGDQITNLPLKKLIAHHNKYEPIATIVTCPIRSPYGVVTLNNDSYSVKDFKEKPILPSIYMNAGIYIFNKQIAEYLPQKGTIERTTFKQLAKENKLKAFVYKGLFATINDNKDLQNTEGILSKLITNFL